MLSVLQTVFCRHYFIKAVFTSNIDLLADMLILSTYNEDISVAFIWWKPLPSRLLCQGDYVWYSGLFCWHGYCLSY